VCTHESVLCLTMRVRHTTLLLHVCVRYDAYIPMPIVFELVCVCHERDRHICKRVHRCTFANVLRCFGHLRHSSTFAPIRMLRMGRDLPVYLLSSWIWSQTVSSRLEGNRTDPFFRSRNGYAVGGCSGSLQWEVGVPMTIRLQWEVTVPMTIYPYASLGGCSAYDPVLVCVSTWSLM